jgi:hypothetical protein
MQYRTRAGFCVFAMKKKIEFKPTQFYFILKAQFVVAALFWLIDFLIELTI